ncbi:glycosyl hydrolase family 43 protein [Phlyctema vagabunda]|uniref:Glycosyl hydrolase family 43 protein n=1 Tax=Phlyctema vagabunda TaxID=108571 RepID=A0ABR4PD15_9HELO
MSRFSFTAAVAVMAATWLSSPVRSSPLEELARRQDISPVIDINFPDPGIVQDANGLWHAYGTNNGVNVPMATASSIEGPWTVSGNALPSVGAWSSGANIWAPDVLQLADGSFVLYYSGEAASTPGKHCIGTATSSSAAGPFVAQDEALACPLDQGGAIDPAGFIDADGSVYVVYKVDGNAIGNGGSCGNTVEPIVPTPLMLQPLASDGTTRVGDPVQVLDRGDADGPLIEAPSLVRTAAGLYILFFSSNCYATTLYDVSYATADSVTGPYTKSAAPLLVTGDYGLEAPGGASVLRDASAIVFHANCPAGRCMFERPITITGRVVST